MKHIRLPYYISLYLSFALLISPLPLIAISEDICMKLSEQEKDVIIQHVDESYIYLGKELSNITELVSILSPLDHNAHSPLAQFKNHIDSDYIIAEYNAVIEATYYMQSILHKNYKKFDVIQANTLLTDIDILINQINKGLLTIDASTLQLLAKTNNDHIISGKRGFTNIMQVKGLLSVNDELVQNITAIDLSATDAIIQNATITTLSTTDQVIQDISATNISVVDETVTGTLSAADAVINGSLQFLDSTSDFIGIQAPSTVPTSYTLTLPSSAPTASQLLRANATTPTNLEWATAGIFNAPSASKTIYVTKYGNDSTGDGSFAMPYLTLTKAIQTANGIASVANPVAINMSSGIYVENNSVGPLTITAAGISIVGSSPTGVIIEPNTPANNLLLITNTVHVASLSFASSSPLGTGVSLSAGNMSVFDNVRFTNFLIGVNCAGGSSNSYAFNLCLFLINGTGINIDDTAVECNSCTISGASTIAGPAANTGVAVTGASASFVFDGGVCGLCATAFDITTNALVTVSNVNFRRNTTDIIQDGASHLTLSTCTFELTENSSDVDLQISGAGTIAEIIGCEFSGTNILGNPQATSMVVSGDATVNISGGVMHDYTTGLQIGMSSDTSSTIANVSGLIIRNCTTDIVQEGAATLLFNASTASSSAITINDSTNVQLAFFDLDDNGALTIGSTANQNTSLIQVDNDPTNHPGLNYKSSLYSTQAIGFENTFGSASSLYSLSANNTDVTSITTDRTKFAGLRLVSDTGSPVGGTSALRGWDINKNGSAAALSFAYQNSDTIGQSAISQYTVMQLDGVNNQLQLPTAATQIVFATDTNLYRSAANVLKTDDNFIVGTLTAGRAVITDPSTNQLESSVTTSTELGFLSGVTSSVQTQLNGKVSKAGDTMTGTLQLPAGTTALPSLVFTGSTTTGLSAPTTNKLSFSTNAVERMAISSTGVVSIDGFTSAGVVHNDSSGNLSSSLIVDADITAATITNDKLANISSSDIAGDIVVRDVSGNFATNMITLDGTTTNPTDAATKAYVDMVASLGLVPKTPALVVSLTDIGSPPAGLQTIDGVTLATNNRVLLVGQTNQVENGLWLAQSGNWTRPADFANGSTADQAYVLITSGAVNAGSSYICNTPSAIVGTDPITFVEFSLPATTTGANVGSGTGLVFRDKTGVTLNFRSLIAGTHLTITNNANDITFTTDATNANTPSTIVARDASGNFSAGTITANLTGSASNNVLKAGDTMTGTLTLPAGTAAAPSLQFTGSTNTGLSAATANVLSFDINGTEEMNLSSSGLTIDGFTTAGVVHNSSAGLLSSSLIVNADVDPAAAIVDTKLATISTAGKVANSATTATSVNTPSTIVLRDSSGNFVAGTITANLTGAASANVLKAGDTMTGTLQLPAGTTALPSLVFTGSTTTGLSANTNVLSFSTNGVERMAIDAAGVVSIDEFINAGVVHNDASGNLSSSLIVNADVDPAAAIIDTKLATISTTGKVANSATTATSNDVANTIVLRDSLGNFSAGTVSFNDAVIGSLTLSGCIANACIIDLSVVDQSISGTLSAADEIINGSVTLTSFSTAGVVHNDATGLLSSSLIVNADVAAGAAIVDTKLATISTAGKVANSATTATSTNTPSTIVLRDSSGNFSAGTITASLNGNAATATTATNFSGSLSGDVTGTQSATVVSFVGGAAASDVAAATATVDAATNLDTASTLVLRDGTGSFAAGVISITDTVISNSETITPFTTAGVVHNNSSGLLSSSLIVNADVSASAAIVDTKLATISTAGKVANSATTATSNNTANTIVLRDSSGNFSAGTITASLSGNATTATTATNFSGSLSGDVTGTQSATVVSFVGGQSAANVAAATVLANAATSANTASAIVKRTASGGFSAGAISVTDTVISNSATITPFTTAGVVHNDATGLLSSSLIVNADVDPAAAIVDTKLATISTAGKVANSATTATSSNTPSTIVLRDSSGNFSAGTITASLSGNATTATTATNFSGSLSGDVTGTQSATVVSFVGGQSAANVAAATVLANAATSANTASTIVKRTASGGFSAGAISVTDEVITNSATITPFSTAGVVHNDATGLLSSSLIVNADVDPAAAIVDTKLATISTAGKVANSATTATSSNTPSTIVLRDSSGNFSAGTITASLSGNATTATTATNFSGSLSGDVTGTQSATVVSFVGGAAASDVAAATATVDAATNLNTANTLVLRDGTGSFAAQVISMTDGVHSGNLVLSTNPSTSTAGNIIKGSSRFIHNFGTNNTFVGINAGNFTMSGSGNNSAFGVSALTANTTGAFNTAMGVSTLAANTIGVNNTAIGYNALLVSTTGTDNTAIGYNTLAANATGTSFNTAVGSNALTANTTGTQNTALGYDTLVANVTGSNNIAIGYLAGQSLTTGSDNIYINADAASTSESDTIRIGTAQTTCFIQGISTSGVSGDGVVVDSNGQLGITLSSRKFKHSIKNMGSLSENIFKLRPVTFVYNNDETNTQQFGLIAEEVDQYFPAIVTKDNNDMPYTVRYNILPILLLNELQKQHATIEEMKKQYVTREEMNNAINALQQYIQNFIH